MYIYINTYICIYIYMYIHIHRNSIFFSANRARPGSQKLSLNGFTEWNSDKNKEKAYQNRE